MYRYRALVLCLVLLSGLARADSSAVFVWNVERDFDQTYQAIYAALEANHFYVVFEPDIQQNLAGFAQRWGEDYNRNDLEAIRAMVFCNGWYANQVSNKDPNMLALCPLHVTLSHKAGVTSVLFVRPSAVAAGSPALGIARELERDVVSAIEQALEVKH